MAETEEKKPVKSTVSSKVPVIVLVVFILLAALTLGIGVSISSGHTTYGCMRISQSGNNVEIATSGIIHVSDKQYYISCGEGDTNPTSPVTVSCLTITPKSVTYSYPAPSNTIYFYLSAGSHAITIPPLATNSSEVLQTTGTENASVAC